MYLHNKLIIHFTHLLLTHVLKWRKGCIYRGKLQSLHTAFLKGLKPAYFFLRVSKAHYKEWQTTTFFQKRPTTTTRTSSPGCTIRLSQKSHILSCYDESRDLVVKFYVLKGFFEIFTFKGSFRGSKFDVYMIFKNQTD